MLTLSACAKINLTLEVISKCEDGFHEIASVLQTISLADEIRFEPSPIFEFVCEDESVDRVDLLEKSALKAVSLLRRGLDYCAGARISLKKAGVPRSAGLGSSSSFPAAILKGLNQLWNMNLSSEKLAQMASMTGSDTPFFIYGGTALAEGRGEKISLLPSLSETWLVLTKPDVEPLPDKTARMYAMLEHCHFSNGTRTGKLVEDIQQGKPLHSDLLYNTFESVAFDFFPNLSKHRDEFLKAGALSVHLAGAGPTLFALVPDEQTGLRITGNLKNKGAQSWLARTV